MKISIIHVPFALGSHRRGSDLGPMAIMHAGLLHTLKEKNYEVYEKTVTVSSETVDHPTLKNLKSVVTTAENIAREVDNALSDKRFPLILGGDHSIALGTIAGVSKHYSNLGVLWVDAHGDVNTDETTPSGNIHGMPLAANLGYGHEWLTEIYGVSPKIKPENVIILGARELDEGEIIFLKEHKISYYHTNDLELGFADVVNKIYAQFKDNGIDGLHVSFDLDSLDESIAPGVGTPVPGGLTFREARYLLNEIKKWDNLVSCEFVEVNPLYDDKNKTAELTVQLINELL